MTAKMPAKVHLRLRFQNLGKPRTAGLCGRAAGACDCGPLSCAFIERPSPLEKPSCKVRLFANRHSREYRQKVTVTTLFQTVSHRDFQLLSQTAHICLHPRKRVHTRLSEKDRTQGHTRRNRGPSLCGHSVVLCCQRNCPERTAGGSGCTPTACVRFLRRRGPAGLRNPVCNLAMLLFFALCAGIPTRAR